MIDLIVVIINGIVKDSIQLGIDIFGIINVIFLNKTLIIFYILLW